MSQFKLVNNIVVVVDHPGAETSVTELIENHARAQDLPFCMELRTLKGGGRSLQMPASVFLPGGIANKGYFVDRAQISAFDALAAAGVAEHIVYSTMQRDQPTGKFVKSNHIFLNSIEGVPGSFRKETTTGTAGDTASNQGAELAKWSEKYYTAGGSDAPPQGSEAVQLGWFRANAMRLQNEALKTKLDEAGNDDDAPDIAEGL